MKFVSDILPIVSRRVQAIRYLTDDPDVNTQLDMLLTELQQYEFDHLEFPQKEGQEEKEKEHPDEWYYGMIPAHCSKEELLNIMTKGVIKFRQTHGEKYDEDMENVLDSWFEHDAIRESQFDHLIPAEDFEDFTKKVLEQSKMIEI